MIDTHLENDQFPQVSNRGIVQLIPKKLYLDWFNYVTNDGIYYSIDNLETISFLIDDFDTRMEFENWLEYNYQLLFEIRLNYTCTNKSQWPETRTFPVFLSWFEIHHSSLILDLKTDLIKIN
jgi:hypothetical protein